MIGTCAACGNYAWDKTVVGCEVHCPRCGSRWPMKKLPVYILTGCSGVGKTTAGQALQAMTDAYIVLDADMFYSLMLPKDEAERMNMVEQVLSLSKNIAQAGKSVVWTMAGGIDMLHHTYGAQFFSSIKVLALTVEEETLRERMHRRGITDQAWIDGSVAYNAYFRTHEAIGDTPFDRLTCTNETPEETAALVLAWLRQNS